MAKLEAFAELSKAVGTDAATDYTAWEAAMTAVKAVTDNSNAGVTLSGDMTYCTNAKNTKNTCCVVATETAITKLMQRTFELRL